MTTSVDTAPLTSALDDLAGTFGYLRTEAAVGNVPPLATMQRAAEDADQALRLAVHTARGQGTSWAQIGQELGVTRQAAQMRFGSNNKKQ